MTRRASVEETMLEERVAELESRVVHLSRLLGCVGALLEPEGRDACEGRDEPEAAA
jgi:hypothetical protein